jgi:hypothetical protein
VSHFIALFFEIRNEAVGYFLGEGITFFDDALVGVRAYSSCNVRDGRACRNQKLLFGFAISGKNTFVHCFFLLFIKKVIKNINIDNIEIDSLMIPM